MFTDALELPHDHFLKSLTRGRGLFHLQTCHGQKINQVVNPHWDVNVIFNPIQTDLHNFPIQDWKIQFGVRSSESGVEIQKNSKPRSNRPELSIPQSKIALKTSD